VKALLDLSTFTAVTGAAVLPIARRTNDRSRDIDGAIREQAISRLVALGTAEESIEILSKYIPPERADVVRSFGESLPPGLQLVTSSNCLMSLPAFHGPTSSEPA
jgi:DNA-K related protein